MRRTLAFELGAYPALLYIEHKRAIRCITQVPVPAVLPRGLLPSCPTARASNRWQTLDNTERLVEQHPLVLVDDGIHLRLDALPHLVKALLAQRQLVPEALKVALHAELVVARRVPEMQARRDREVRLEHQRELSNDPLAPGARVAHKQTRLGRVKDTLCGVDELTNLQRGGPHGALAARDRRASVAVVEKLVGNEGAAEA